MPFGQEMGPYGGPTAMAPPVATPPPPPSPAGPFQAQPTALPPAGPVAQAPGPYQASQPITPQPRPEAMQDRMKFIIPALVAAFGPKIGARGTAAMLTGLMHGRDAKLAMQEHVEETQRRRAFEAADFRKNAVDELLASDTPEELQAKFTAMQGMAEFHGIDLQSALAQAVGVVTNRVAEKTTTVKRSKAMEVVKANDQTNPGNWSAPDDTGEMHPREWWVAQAGAPGLLPGKAPVPKRTPVKTVGPDGKPMTKGVTDEELAAGVPDYVAPNTDQEWVTRNGKVVPIAKGGRQPGDRPYTPPSQAQPDYEWVVRAGTPLQIRKGTARPGDTPYDAVAARQDTTDKGPSAYAVERATRTLQSVDELLGKVSGWTTGFGSLLASVPTTDARNFRAELDTLKSNIAFNELTQMREASKTGGALGQVSDRENQLLSSALGALDAGQSPENITAQLQKIKASITRWNAAQAQGKLAPGGGSIKILKVEQVGP